MPDIRLPDGRIIKNVPEGTTKEQLTQKLINKGLLSGQENFLQQDKPSQVAQPPEDDANIFLNYGQKAIRGLLQAGPALGSLASGASQRVAELMGREDISASIGKRIAEEEAKLTPEERAARSVFKIGAGFLVPGATVAKIAGGSALMSALEPTESGTRGEAVRQIATGATVGAATGGLLKGAGAGISKVRQTLKTKPDTSAGAIRELANKSYREAEEKGGIFKGKIINRVLDEVNKLKPTSKVAKTLESKSPINSISKDLEKFRGQNLNLDDMQALDEYLGKIVDNATELGRVKKEGQPVATLQTKLRDILDKAGKDDIVNGSEGLEALKRGRNLWSRSSKLRDVEAIINRAALSPNEATAIKTGFRTLASNPNRLRGFTPQEKKLIKDAAKSGITSDTLRTLGSRLLPIGTAVSGGGIGATVGAKAASDISRSAAARVQAGRASKVEKEIIQSVFPEVYKLKPILRKEVTENLIKAGALLGTQQAIN